MTSKAESSENSSTYVKYQELDSAEEAMQIIDELHRSKLEVEIARAQFDAVVDPLLVDHIIFRLSAAEKRLNYLLQSAKRQNIVLEGVRWDLPQWQM